jgi:hypothetical protein
VTNVMVEFEKRLQQEHSDTNSGFICGLIILIYWARKQRKLYSNAGNEIHCCDLIEQIAIWCGK